MNTQCVQQNLIWYTEQGDLNKVELLLIGGLNPDVAWADKNGKKFFALHVGSKAGNEKMVELLLAYGANINQLNGSDTPLMTAIESGKTNVAKLFIEKEADLNIMNSASVNALYIAQRKKNTEIVELLKKAGAHEMTQEELKVHKKKKIAGKISVVIALAGCIWIAQICSNHSSSSSGGSGSSSGSSMTHTCLNYNKSYSGYGFATIGGEEYALDKDRGNQYCSRACAKASRTGKFKNL